MRNAVLIANPSAGQGGPEQRHQAIQLFCRSLKDRGVDVEVRPTLGPHDATRLAAEAVREGYRDVIVSGGDGTINEALQGLIGLPGSPVRLAIWPRGTANVLGGELGLPREPDRIAEIVAKGTLQRVHVGCATIKNTGQQRYFLLMAGLGLDAAIAESVEPGLKKRVGEAAFWYAGLRQFVRWKPVPFTVEVDGKSYPATFAAIGNARGYGGKLRITPRARMHVPEFEICIIHSRNRLRFLKLLLLAKFGGIPDSAKGATFLRTTDARAIGNGAQVQVDGEVIGSLPMSFAISPHTIDLVVAKGALDGR
jgi:diacylglycerol kinase (ATP)